MAFEPLSFSLPPFASEEQSPVHVSFLFYFFMLNQPRAKCCLNRGFSTGLWRLAPWHTTTKIFLCEVAFNQGMATSWALFQELSVTHICSAASWSSPHGLVSCIVCMWQPFQCHMHSLHPFSCEQSVIAVTSVPVQLVMSSYRTECLWRHKFCVRASLTYVTTGHLP